MPEIDRPKTRPLYVPFDVDVFEKLHEFCQTTGRDYKTEITFALLKHFKDGYQPLPPELKKEPVEKPRVRKKKEGRK